MLEDSCKADKNSLISSTTTLSKNFSVLPIVAYSYRCSKTRNSSVQINLLKASTTLLLSELVLKKLIRISRKERFRLCSSCETLRRLWHLKTRTRTRIGTRRMRWTRAEVASPPKGSEQTRTNEFLNYLPKRPTLVCVTRMIWWSSLQRQKRVLSRLPRHLSQKRIALLAL